MSKHIHFKWYDFWVGWYYNCEKRILYVCPIPMLVIDIPMHDAGKDAK